MSDARLYGTGEGGSAALPMRWRLVASAALLVALALLALTLAHWGWQWFGPAPAVVPPPAAETDYSRRVAEAHLFGTPTAPAAAWSRRRILESGRYASPRGHRRTRRAGLRVVPRRRARAVADRGRAGCRQWREARSDPAGWRDVDRRGGSARDAAAGADPERQDGQASCNGGGDKRQDRRRVPRRRDSPGRSCA